MLASGIIGGMYMLLVTLFSMWFGTVVDKHKKKRVMHVATLITLGAFIFAALLYRAIPHETITTLHQPWFWLFALILLVGAVVENIRNIAMGTVVTLLVEKEKRANANGLVGIVAGIGMIITSVFSGVSVGVFGLGWTLVIACVLTAFSYVHLFFVDIPEKEVAHDPTLKTKQLI